MGWQSVELEDNIKMEPKEWDGRVWTGFFRLRIHKVRGIS